jgi:hypothetical protein
MYDTVDLKILLNRIKINPNLRQLNIFEQLFIRKQLKKDEFFIREGSLNYNIAFLLKGVMRLYILDDEGNETNLRFIKENELFSGSYSFGTETVVNIQCMEDCTMLMANGCDFCTITNSFQQFAHSYNCLLDCLYKKSMFRLTSYIKLNAKDRYKLFLKDNPGMINRIPLYHIANHLGMTPVQLSRIRAKISE